MDPIQRFVTDANALKLQEANELFRELHSQLPASVICCFLYVASHHGCHKKALEEDLGLKPSTGSRVTDWLSDYHPSKEPLGLIQKVTDPTNRKRQLLVLTDKGKQLSQRLESLVFS